MRAPGYVYLKNDLHTHAAGTTTQAQEQIDRNDLKCVSERGDSSKKNPANGLLLFFFWINDKIIKLGKLLAGVYEAAAGY